MIRRDTIDIYPTLPYPTLPYRPYCTYPTYLTYRTYPTYPDLPDLPTYLPPYLTLPYLPYPTLPCAALRGPALHPNPDCVQEISTGLLKNNSSKVAFHLSMKILETPNSKTQFGSG